MSWLGSPTHVQIPHLPFSWFVCVSVCVCACIAACACACLYRCWSPTHRTWSRQLRWSAVSCELTQWSGADQRMPHCRRDPSWNHTESPTAVLRLRRWRTGCRRRGRREAAPTTKPRQRLRWLRSQLPQAALLVPLCAAAVHVAAYVCVVFFSFSYPTTVWEPLCSLT